MRIVLASSRAVYGEGLYHCQRCGDVSPSARAAAALRHGWWDPICPVCSGTIDPVAIHEAAQVSPGSIYAATKLSQEHLCRVIGNVYGIPITILRYFNVYGPGQSLSNPYTGILSTFYARATSGKAIEVYEDGQMSRDFVFIGDVVEATRRALISPGDQVQSRIVNVGTGVPVSIEALARTMLRLGGWDVPVRVAGAYRLGDVRHAFADTRRLKDLLGMASFTSLGAGLRQWLHWAKGNDAHDATEVAQGQLAGRGLYRHAHDC
jgi:dTDP-L-rhamnose 4-epimerase